MKTASWSKVIGDIRDKPARSILIALAIFVGVLAMTTVFGAASILSREVESSFLSSVPPSVVITLNRVDDKAVAKALEIPGVKAAEKRRLVRARVATGDNQWQALRIFVVDNFIDQKMSRVEAISGDWPPRDGTFLIEQSSLTVANAQVGRDLTIRVPNGNSYDVPVGGVVQDAGQAPGWIDQIVYVYCTSETLDALGLPDEFDELQLIVDGNGSVASQVASTVASTLSLNGYDIERVEVPHREHPHADHMDSMLVVLRLFSILSFVMSAVMAASVIATLMTKQSRQIGIMMTMGATASAIAWLYTRLTLLLAVAGVGAAIPIGLWTAAKLSVFMASHLNLVLVDTQVSTSLVTIQAVIGIAIPVLASRWIAGRNVRMTAREAIDSRVVEYSLWLPRWFGGGRIAVGSVARALALRNTLRRPFRLTLTVGTLAVGGAIVMTAANVYSSLTAGLESTMDAQGHDLEIRLAKLVPRADLLKLVRQNAAVDHVEAWGAALVGLANPSSNEPAVSSERYTILAVPDDTRFYSASLVAGRWPESGELDVVVANRTLSDQYSMLELDEEVELVMFGQRRTVRLIGIVEEISPPNLYTNDATFGSLIGSGEIASALRLTTQGGDTDELAGQLEEQLSSKGWVPMFAMTRNNYRDSLLDHFQIVLICLSACGVAAVAVGGLSLVTSMGMNVIERASEIGVARTIGARSGAIRRMLLTEGFVLGFLSILLALVIAWPVSVGLTIFIGEIGPHVRLPQVLSWVAIVAWACFAFVSTGLACWFAARQALNLPVTLVLARE